MKAVRYGLIAFFGLATVWTMAHFVVQLDAAGASIPVFQVMPAAGERARHHWRYLPILR